MQSCVPLHEFIAIIKIACSDEVAGRRAEKNSFQYFTNNNNDNNNSRASSFFLALLDAGTIHTFLSTYFFVGGRLVLFRLKFSLLITGLSSQSTSGADPLQRRKIVIHKYIDFSFNRKPIIHEWIYGRTNSFAKNMYSFVYRVSVL